MAPRGLLPDQGGDGLQPFEYGLRPVVAGVETV